MLSVSRYLLQRAKKCKSLFVHKLSVYPEFQMSAHALNFQFITLSIVFERVYSAV